MPESIENIVTRSLHLTLSAVERDEAEVSRHYLLDQVKLVGKTRKVDDMFKMRELIDSQLSAALSRCLDQLARGGIVLSEEAFWKSLKEAAIETATNTERHYKNPVLPRPDQTMRTVLPVKRTFLERLLGRSGEDVRSRVIHRPKPIPNPLNREPTYEDRFYYADILYDTATLIALTNPSIRKYFSRRSVEATNPTFSDESYLTIAIQTDLSTMIDRDAIKLDRGHRPKDKKMLAGLKAVNALMRVVEGYEGEVSYRAFCTIARGQKGIINYEIDRTIGNTLDDNEFEQVLALMKGCLEDHAMDLVDENRESRVTVRPIVSKVIDVPVSTTVRSGQTILHPYGTPIRGDTRLGPYGTVAFAPSPFSRDNSTGETVTEEVVILSPDMLKSRLTVIESGRTKLEPSPVALRSQRTIRDPALLVAINLKLEYPTSHRISQLYGSLEDIGIGPAAIVTVVDNFRSYARDLRDIVETNKEQMERRGKEINLQEILTKANIQLRSTERDSYLERYGAIAEELLDMASSLAQDSDFLDQAMKVATVLAKQGSGTDRSPRRPGEKYRLIGLSEDNATGVLWYVKQIADERFNPEYSWALRFIGVMNKVVTEEVRTKATNGSFDLTKFDTYLNRLFEDIIPDGKRAKYNFNLHTAWGRAVEECYNQLQSIPEETATTEEKVQLQVTKHFLGKVKEVHDAYERIKPR